MVITQVMPLVAAVALVIFAVRRVISQTISQNGWKFAAFLSVIFFLWSMWAVITEGPLGFWPVHTANLWGNQVWFDLLIAVGIGWFLVLERARSQSMNLHGWLILILCTGCIGFLAMISRLLFLETRNAETSA